MRTGERCHLPRSRRQSQGTRRSQRRAGQQGEVDYDESLVHACPRLRLPRSLRPHHFEGAAPNSLERTLGHRGEAHTRARATVEAVSEVDVVVVSYNSVETLRDCVAELADADGVSVIVVDNASSDGSLETVADLAVRALRLETNLGFASGCNRGAEAGTAPSILFLNPDARIDVASLRRLVAVVEADERIALVAPVIADGHGAVDFSIRRFPRLRSTYSRALFLHRAFPYAAWSDEIVRDTRAYAQRGPVEWVSGACMLVRRAALVHVGGWDEGFFLYGEDIDICRRMWSAGYRVEFEPAAQAVHVGGRSAPRASLLPTLVASRLRYAQLHNDKGTALLERMGVALGELTHAMLTTKGSAGRMGHIRGLRVAFGLTGAPTAVDGPNSSI